MGYKEINFDDFPGGPPNMPPKKSDQSDGIWWLIIILGFCFGIWPVSVVLLILKFSNKLPNLTSLFSRMTNHASRSIPRQTNRSAQHTDASPEFQQEFYRRKAAEAARNAAQTARNAAKQPNQAKKPEPVEQKPESAEKNAVKPKNPGKFASLLTILGVIVAIIGVIQILDNCIFPMLGQGTWDAILFELGYYIGELVQGFGWTISGVILFLLGKFRKRKGKRYDQLITMIGENDFLPIDQIADATGRSYNRTVADLQDMIDRGYLPGAWLDLQRRRLMMTELKVDEQPAKSAQPKPETPPVAETVSESEQILQRIRTANDLIADPDISRKIDRIESLTAKIFRCLEEQPEKRDLLTSFLNYYLPQTLKILELYALLEKQGVEGENIAAAKTRISGMLDKLADGYERQLDRLFSEEVLDITADISVMEQMLARDGLGEEILRPDSLEVHDDLFS